MIIVYSEFGHVWRLRFFRTLEACQRVAAANRAAAEARRESGPVPLRAAGAV